MFAAQHPNDLLCFLIRPTSFPKPILGTVWQCLWNAFLVEEMRETFLFASAGGDEALSYCDHVASMKEQR